MGTLKARPAPPLNLLPVVVLIVKIIQVPLYFALEVATCNMKLFEGVYAQ